jgi:hypothetical protein
VYAGGRRWRLVLLGYWRRGGRLNVMTAVADLVAHVEASMLGNALDWNAVYEEYGDQLT